MEGIECSRRQDIVPVSYEREIAHPLFQLGPGFIGDMGPQRRKDEVRVIHPDNLVLAHADIRSERLLPGLRIGRHIVPVVLVVPGNEEGHAVVGGAPVEEAVLLVGVELPQGQGVAGKHEDIPRDLERAAGHEDGVVVELQVKV